MKVKLPKTCEEAGRSDEERGKRKMKKKSDFSEEFFRPFS